MYFAYSAWTSFRDPSFDFEFKTIEKTQRMAGGAGGGGWGRRDPQPFKG